MVESPKSEAARIYFTLAKYGCVKKKIKKEKNMEKYKTKYEKAMAKLGSAQLTKYVS